MKKLKFKFCQRSRVDRRDWKVQISEQELKNLLIDQRILNNWFEMMMIKKDPCHLPFYEIRSRKCRYVCSTLQSDIW